MTDLLCSNCGCDFKVRGFGEHRSSTELFKYFWNEQEGSFDQDDIDFIDSSHDEFVCLECRALVEYNSPLATALHDIS